MLELKPLKKYDQPRYPDKQTVLSTPEILDPLPERWKNNVVVGTALSTLLVLTLTACAKPTRVSVTGEGSGKSAGVAPIFEHGTGRGSFGCVSVAPPAFLSEEEAYQVIQEEIKKYGIAFEKAGFDLRGVQIPETRYSSIQPQPGGGTAESPLVNSSQSGSLAIDGYDAAKKIGYEFISTDDYGAWLDKKGGMYSTVQSYDFLAAAKILREGLANKTGDNTFGIFYDPVTRLSSDGKPIVGNLTKVMAKEDLRAQVKDFLEWLRAQGIV